MRTLRRQIKEECWKDYRILPLSFSFTFEKTLQCEKTKQKLSPFEVFSQRKKFRIRKYRIQPFLLFPFDVI